ncbi:MAG: hypothetical protein ABI863_05560 [Ginsengibacter sp.]
MKILFITAFICLFPVLESCKKNNDNKINLSLLQYKWTLISHNGEALRYVGMPGDYYDFETNDTLRTHNYNSFDTLVYNLSANGQMLSIYPVMNGIKSGTAIIYKIDVLTTSALIISANAGPGVNILDSLRR